MIDRKPCPACHCPSSRIIHWNGKYHVQCGIICTDGPKRDTEEDAVADWNSIPVHIPRSMWEEFLEWRNSTKNFVMQRQPSSGTNV